MLRTSLLIAPLIVLVCAHPVHAVDPECDGTGLDETGQCVATFEGVHWCTDNGTYRVLSCSDGDICAESLDISGAASGYTCIPRALTECADIPNVGVCVSTEVLLWCNAGEVESADCVGDTECGWDTADEEYDCVAKGRLNSSEGVPSGSGEDAGPEASQEGSPELFVPGDIVAGGPRPTLQSNVALDPEASAGSGCGATRGVPHPPSALFVLLMGWLFWRSLPKLWLQRP